MNHFAVSIFKCRPIIHKCARSLFRRFPIDFSLISFYCAKEGVEEGRVPINGWVVDEIFYSKMQFKPSNCTRKCSFNLQTVLEMDSVPFPKLIQTSFMTFLFKNPQFYQ